MITVVQVNIHHLTENFSDDSLNNFPVDNTVLLTIITIISLRLTFYWKFLFFDYLHPFPLNSHLWQQHIWSVSEFSFFQILGVRSCRTCLSPSDLFHLALWSQGPSVFFINGKISFFIVELCACIHFLYPFIYG